MTRLVYVTHQFPVVTETFTINEVDQLERAGLAVDVATLRPPPPNTPAALRPLLGRGDVIRPQARDGLMAASAVVPAIARGKPRRAVAALRGAALARSLRGVRAHVHAQFPLDAASAAYFAARMAGTTFSFSAHTLHELDLMPQKLAAATFVVAGSEFERDVVAERYGERWRERIRVQRLGVPPREARDEAGVDAQLVVSIGSLARKKGHDVLVDAIALLAARGTALRLEIVGEGPERSALEARIRDRGVAELVTLVGAEGQPAALARAAGAAVFALACLRTDDGDHDCLPVALMDAMSMGVPVVTSNAFGIPELVESGRSGVLVPPRDPEALATALAGLVSDPGRAREIGRGGRVRVREAFDLETNAQRLATLFADRLA